MNIRWGIQLKIFNYNDDDKLSTTKYENTTEMNARGKAETLSSLLNFLSDDLLFILLLLLLSGTADFFVLFILLLLINKINTMANRSKTKDLYNCQFNYQHDY